MLNAPAQIVRDARTHRVDVWPVSINHSHWDCTLERAGQRDRAARPGFRQVRGPANVRCAVIVGARGPSPYESVDEVWRRSPVPFAAIERFAEVDGRQPRGRRG